MPTTGWSSCGAKRARCSKACSISAGAARSSRAPSATSSCAPAWPAWSSSTSATRRSTSGVSTVCPKRGTVSLPPVARCWASPSTSAVSPSRARTTNRWWWTGAPRWPSRSTGPPAWTRRAWPGAGISPCGAGRCSGSRTSTSSTPTAGWARRRPPEAEGRRTGTAAGSGCSPTGWSWAGPARSCPLWARPGRATWATSSAPSSASRTRSSAAPLPGVLVVQGGPGTGKTAVALHRAAYLLYTHRFPLERQGVLVVGPNPLFLRYIEQVLPSLGETGVSLSTVAGLVPEVRVRGVDDPGVAKLKGDVRMVKVLARAVRTRQRPLRRDVEVPFGAGVLRLRARTTDDIVAMARRRPGHPQPAAALRGGAGPPRAVGRVPGEAGPQRGRGRRGALGRGAEGPGAAVAPGARGRGRPRPDVAPPLAPRVPARSARCPPAARRGGQGHPGRGGGAAPLPAPQRLARDRAVDGGGRRAHRRGADPARPTAGPPGPHPGAAQRGGGGHGGRVLAPGTGGLPGAGHEPAARVRGRGPRLRAHRGGRGAGPLADAAAHVGPSLAVGLHDRRGGHRAGHGAVGARGLGRHHAASEPPAPAAPGGAHGELPHPGRGGGAGGAGARHRGAGHRAAPPGAPVGLRPPDRRHQPGRAVGHGWPTWPARRWPRWRRAGSPSWGPPSCCPS